MQNAAAVEALYSATFVEDYLDCVENFPNDLQRHLSRLREFDLTQYSEFLRDLDGLVTAFENEKTAAGQWQVLAKIQLGLIAAQDIGDEKMATAQDLNELIEKKACLLKQDAENLDFGDDEEEDEAPVPNGGGSGSGGGGGNKAAEKKPAGSTTPRPESSQASSAAVSSKTPKTNEKSKNKPAGEDKSAQKRRKKPEKAGKGGDPDGDHPPEKKAKGGGSGGGDGGNKTPGGSGAGGKKPGKTGVAANKGPNKNIKGPTGGGSKSAGSERSRREVSAAAAAAAAASAQADDSDEGAGLAPFDIDPDEPTYCLCEQVSFGEMVACDNDLCPFEWFHFDCVQLSSKPKGKWFCPKCRGDKTSVMKPKAQLARELEKYNREREEKMGKK